MDDLQYKEIKEYLKSLSPGSKITAANLAAQNGLSFQQIQKILQELVKSDFLKCVLVIRCPVCGLLLVSVKGMESVEKEIHCYHCDKTVEISSDDIEEIYTFNQYPL